MNLSDIGFWSDGQFLDIRFHEAIFRSLQVPRSVLGLPQDTPEDKRLTETISGPLKAIRKRLRGKDG